MPKYIPCETFIAYECARMYVQFVRACVRERDREKKRKSESESEKERERGVKDISRPQDMLRCLRCLASVRTELKSQHTCKMPSKVASAWNPVQWREGR